MDHGYNKFYYQSNWHNLQYKPLTEVAQKQLLKMSIYIMKIVSITFVMMIFMFIVDFDLQKKFKVLLLCIQFEEVQTTDCVGYLIVTHTLISAPEIDFVPGHALF